MYLRNLLFQFAGYVLTASFLKKKTPFGSIFVLLELRFSWRP
jgi:hypothetical protein